MPDQYYLAKQADFTAVADAIRTKGGTSAALEWPSEFVSAVGALPDYKGDFIKLIEHDGASVSIPSGATKIGANVFRQYTNLASVGIPDGVKTLGANAFNGCTGLATVVLPDSVYQIANTVFSSCTALTNVVLGSGLTSIGSTVFSGCTALASITFKGQTPPGISNSNTWTNVPTTCVIHVPYSADHSILAAYKAKANMPNPNTYTYVDDVIV